MSRPGEQAERQRGPTDLDEPESDEHLYEIPEGEPDDDLRPVCQGDVYAGICLAGYEGEHDNVILATHPCSMREGPVLRSRIQAFAVTPYQHVAPAKWVSGFKKIMPLPALEGKNHRAGQLTDTGVVSPVQLAMATRVATLSPQGILLLQQRIVWTVAHAVVRLDTLAEHTAPALTELELLEAWNEEMCGHLDGEERASALAQTAHEFDRFVNGDLRKALAVPEQIGDARIAIRAEGRRRGDALRGA